MYTSILSTTKIKQSYTILFFSYDNILLFFNGKQLEGKTTDREYACYKKNNFRALKLLIGFLKKYTHKPVLSSY